MAMSPRLLRPQPSRGFNPKSIPGLMGWWDASDTATLGPTSSGPGAVSNNGPVKYLGDKSGLGRHFTQSGADSVSPTFIANGQSGKSVLAYDGGDTLNSAFTVALTSETAFVVFLDSGTSANGRFFSQSDAGADFSTSGHYIPMIKFTTNTFGSYANGGHRALVGDTSSAWKVACSIHTGSQIQNSINNGVAETFSHTLNKTFTRFGLGDVNATVTGGMVGRVAEVVCYSRALASAERDAVARYLGKKWGVSVA